MGVRGDNSIWIFLALLLLGMALLSLNSGYISISPFEVWQTMIGQGSRKQQTVLFFFRGPRIVIAMLVGMGLAVAGGILQGVTRNGLADPGILGINAGAGVGVMALLLFQPMSDTQVFSASGAVLSLPFAALAGGMVAATLVYLLARKDGVVSRTGLVLTGVAVASGLAALMLVLALAMHQRLYDYAVTWLAGTIDAAGWDSVLSLLPWLVVLLPLALWRSHVLNLLGLGDGAATGIGLNVQRERLALLAIAVALASACVAVGGGIGFVGLMAPHIARQLVGPDHRRLLPAAALVGASLMVIADMVSRSIIPEIEIPVGVVVSALGAPYFIFLLARGTK